MPVGLHIQVFVSCQLFVATRGHFVDFKFDANAVQDYMVRRGVRIPSSGRLESGNVLPNLVAFAFGCRMANAGGTTAF